MEKEIVLSEKEAFLERIKDSELRAIVGARLEQVTKQDKSKEHSKALANITRELLESEYMTFEDGSSLTFNDLLVSRAVANSMMSYKTGFKELNEAQKVIEGVTSDSGGVNIVIIGQDLGD